MARTYATARTSTPGGKDPHKPLETLAAGTTPTVPGGMMNYSSVGGFKHGNQHGCGTYTPTSGKMGKQASEDEE